MGNRTLPGVALGDTHRNAPGAVCFNTRPTDKHPVTSDDRVELMKKACCEVVMRLCDAAVP